VLRLGLSVAVAIAVADQAFKAWMIPTMQETGAFAVTSFLNLVMVWNRGVSFGMFGGGALPPWLLAALGGAVCVGLGVWLRRADGRWLAVAIGAIIGGALGNIADRLARGAVADFFDFHVGAYHWPAFNTADVAISIGVVMLLLDPLFRRDEKHRLGK